MILVVCLLAWLYLRKQRKVEASVALAAVALVVAFGLPVLAKPIEDAWSPVTAGGLPTIPVPPLPIPAPDEKERALGTGWGPKREMFTLASPASYVTLNSITDNPYVGDERSFYAVRHIDKDCKSNALPWQRHEKIADGDYLLFRVYVENSVADNLDADGSHTAQGLRLKVDLPAVVGDPATGSAGQAETSATLIADNTNPNKYWYVVLLSSEESVRLDLVPRTSMLNNNHFGKSGLALPDSFLYEPGMQLGYDKLDGNLRAGYQYALYMSFCVKVSGTRS
ncbi:hypothetical protein [Amycolatopsis vastitatis]|uniref:hypothetical protein n=1 Tax=Amycolatopsis vastitatis TaxID=1905142 RepID=UPI001177383D|nr:hypothetical protein [Amycolatopsis vastitatis]